MNAQGTFFYHRIWPDPTEQLPLKDSFTRALDQCDQDIQRPNADPYRLAVFEDQPLSGAQPERSKGEDRVFHLTQRPRNKGSIAANLGIRDWGRRASWGAATRLSTNGGLIKRVRFSDQIILGTN